MVCARQCSRFAGPDGQSASVYERTMAAFGAIMQFYDPLRSFPLWGFGDQVGLPLQVHACNTFCLAQP